MGKYDKLIDKILRGTSEANIPIDDLRGILTLLGFHERIRGSYHVYRKEGIEEKLNLQRDGSKAKPYQVRQIRFNAIQLWLDTAKEFGDPIPEPKDRRLMYA